MSRVKKGNVINVSCSLCMGFFKYLFKMVLGTFVNFVKHLYIFVKHSSAHIYIYIYIYADETEANEAEALNLVEFITII